MGGKKWHFVPFCFVRIIVRYVAILSFWSHVQHGWFVHASRLKKSNSFGRRNGLNIHKLFGNVPQNILTVSVVLTDKLTIIERFSKTKYRNYYDSDLWSDFSLQEPQNKNKKK